MSAALRDIAVTKALDRHPNDPCGARIWRRAESSVQARPQRLIGVSDARDWFPDRVYVTPTGARQLAADLLEAAGLAEQPNPVDEVWDAEHGLASA